MRVVIKKPNEEMEVIEIEDELEILQKIVGGYIETTRFPDDTNIIIIVNEDGKRLRLNLNFNLIDKNCCVYDELVGNVIFVGDGGENFRSLTKKEIKTVEKFINEVC